MDFVESFPGSQPDEDDQADENCALRGDAFLSLVRIVGNELVEEVLKTIHARDGERDVGV